MPIALYAATQVAAMLKTKFGENTFVDARHRFVHRQDNAKPEDDQTVIVQLDAQSTPTDKGALPGLHWLEAKLGLDHISAGTSILITAWNKDLFAPNSAVRLRAYLGGHPRANLLASPLIRFVALDRLMTMTDVDALRERFPKIDAKEVAVLDRLVEDIKQNCYTRLGVASQCHRLRRLVHDYWTLHPDDSAQLIFARFHADINALSVRLLIDLPPVQRASIVLTVRQLHNRLREAADFSAFEMGLSALEKLLIPLDEIAPPALPDLNTQVLIMNPKRELLTDLIDHLLSWGVRADWVATWPDAEQRLRMHADRYCCLFSHFRHFAPDGKLTPRQGYDNLYALRLAYPLFPSAFLTSMSQARWEQPGYERWPAFDLKELSPFRGKSVYALYFFIKNAEDQRINRCAKVPDNCAKVNKKNAFQHMHHEGMAGEALRYLRGRTQEALNFVQAYAKAERLGLNWRISTRYLTNEGPRDRSFVFERLFYRLTILAMLRQPHWGGELAHPDQRLRFKRVEECIWAETDRYAQVEYTPGKGGDCNEYLRIDRTVQYHQRDLDDLYADGCLFYHEYQLLPRLVIPSTEI